MSLDEATNLYVIRHAYMGAFLRFNDNMKHCLDLIKLFRQLASNETDRMQLEETISALKKKDTSLWSRPEFAHIVRKVVHIYYFYYFILFCFYYFVSLFR